LQRCPLGPLSTTSPTHQRVAWTAAYDPKRTRPSLQCDAAAVVDEWLFCDRLAGAGLVGIGFSLDTGFHVLRVARLYHGDQRQCGLHGGGIGKFDRLGTTSFHSRTGPANLSEGCVIHFIGGSLTRCSTGKCPHAPTYSRTSTSTVGGCSDPQSEKRPIRMVGFSGPVVSDDSLPLARPTRMGDACVGQFVAVPVHAGFQTTSFAKRT